MACPESKADPAAGRYRGAAGHEYHEGKRALAPAAREWVMRLRAEKFQPHVRSDAVVFELGVGSGWNLGKLNCARKLGADAADFLAETIQAAGIQFVANTRELPDGVADVVICHHALEHLAEPLGALHEMRRLLNSQGRLVLHVPWERETRYARYRADEPNHHLYTWNAQTLGNLVAVAGLEVLQVRVRAYGYDRVAANLAVKLHLGESGFRMVRAMMVRLRPLREVELLARKI